MKRCELERFFYPRHVAVVGVSSKNLNFGGASFLVKLQESNFKGDIYPINPKAEQVSGLKAYPTLSDLPEVPDLAMVCVPARYVPEVLEECGKIGTRHIHILTSGFKETKTPEGRDLESRVVRISKKYGLQVMGPNCMGPYCPSSGLTAWGAIPGLSGPVGIISQSGLITQRLTEYLFYLGVGVEKAVSMGNAAVLNCTDYLEFMAGDDRIKVIAMYLEGIEDGVKLLRLARDISPRKPVVLWKGGTSDIGAATASSHTGSMAGQYEIWKAFFRQTGVVEVDSMDAWADTVLAFCLLPAPLGNGVFLVGGGGGNSVTNSDACVAEGLRIPPLGEDAMEWLRRTVPEAGSIAGNPLDHWLIFGDPGYLGSVLDMAEKDPGVGMIIIDRLIPRKAFHSFDEADPTPRVIEMLRKGNLTKPKVFTVDSEGGDPELAEKGASMRSQLCRAGIPAYPSLKRAARALTRLHDYHQRFSSPNKAI